MCIVKNCEDNNFNNTLCDRCRDFLITGVVPEKIEGKSILSNMLRTIEALAQERELLIVHAGIMYKSSTAAIKKFPAVKDILDKELE